MLDEHVFDIHVYGVSIYRRKKEGKNRTMIDTLGNEPENNQEKNAPNSKPKQNEREEKMRRA